MNQFDPATHKHDGVHTFKQMEQLALDWKNKYHDRVDEIQQLSIEFSQFLEDVAKQLGIQVGREIWWDAGRREKIEKIHAKITKMKARK